jgi:hypothetical protein
VSPAPCRYCPYGGIGPLRPHAVAPAPWAWSECIACACACLERAASAVRQRRAPRGREGAATTPPLVDAAVHQRRRPASCTI